MVNVRMWEQKMKVTSIGTCTVKNVESYQLDESKIS